MNPNLIRHAKFKFKKQDLESEEETDDSELLEENFDRESRTVFLFDEISGQTTLQCIKGLMILDRTPGEITLMINSEGGSVADGWALIDFVSQMKNPINGMVFGAAFSMASLILQACKTRSMSKHSYLMVHAGSIEIDTDTNSAILNADYLKRDLEITMEYYRARSRITPRKMKELMSQDSFLDANECLKFGLIDQII